LEAIGNGKTKPESFGLFTFVFISALGVMGLHMRGPVPLPNVDIETWAVAVRSENYFAAQALILLA